MITASSRARRRRSPRRRIIAGGHTVTDAEPKFGLVVTGTIHPDQVWTKAGALQGDVLFLTKPIGRDRRHRAQEPKAHARDVEAATARC